MTEHILGWVVAGVTALGSVIAGAMSVGKLQARLDDAEEQIEACKKQHDTASEHNMQLVERVTSMETTIKNVDRNVERLINRQLGEL